MASKKINSLMTRFIYPDVKPLYTASSVISTISYIIRLLDYFCETNYDYLDELILIQDFLSSLKKKLLLTKSNLLPNDLKPLIIICKQIIKKAGYESDYPAKMWLLRVLNESKSKDTLDLDLDLDLSEYIKINYELYDPLILTEIDKVFIEESINYSYRIESDSKALSESIQSIYIPNYLIRVCSPSLIEYLSFICTPHYLDFKTNL